MNAFRTKKDYALDAIRALILAGELDPGEHLHQADLAARLQVSLTPVREALRQLESEGVVAATAHRGVRVRTTDLAELRSVYLSRRVIEPYLAGRGALLLTDEDVERACAALEEIEAAKRRDDAIGIRRANYDFHFCLYDRADTPILVETAQKLWTRFPWDVLSVVPRRREASVAEHDRILAAMVARDPETAAAACADHLTQSYIDIERYLGHPARAVDPYPYDGVEAADDETVADAVET